MTSRTELTQLWGSGDSKSRERKNRGNSPRRFPKRIFQNTRCPCPLLRKGSGGRWGAGRIEHESQATSGHSPFCLWRLISPRLTAIHSPVLSSLGTAGSPESLQWPTQVPKATGTQGAQTPHVWCRVALAPGQTGRLCHRKVHRKHINIWGYPTSAPPAPVLG